MRERHRGLTARGHILWWMLLPVAVALAAVVLIAARVLFAQVDSDARRELSHESEKFRNFATRGDPVDNQPFASVDAVLASYLTHNTPNTNETFFSVLDGRAHQRSAAAPPSRLDLDAAFVRRAATAERPTWGKVDSDAGEAYFGVVPVRLEGHKPRGALVVVEFLHDERAEAWSTVRLIGFVAIGALMLAGVLGWLITGRVLAPIRAVRQTAEGISESDLSRRIEVTGTDDVAQLAETFNGMLDRVEGAFVAQREFLDDAGHELRTPITIIRGHLELAAADPADAAQSRSLVIAELDRMGRIVDDLLVLAKAERPDFVIKAPVDLAELVMDTLAKVQAIAPRRWAVAEVPEAVALADGQRLTQALMQLVSNAVRHTAEGDTITLGARVDGGRMRLWVSDTGRGIPAEEQAVIFNRFARGAGHRRSDGAGLGLAIVATIAAAHDGEVTVDSEVGRGSTFTLDLPFEPAEGHEP